MSNEIIPAGMQGIKGLFLIMTWSFRSKPHTSVSNKLHLDTDCNFICHKMLVKVALLKGMLVLNQFQT